MALSEARGNQPPSIKAAHQAANQLRRKTVQNLCVDVHMRIVPVLAGCCYLFACLHSFLLSIRLYLLVPWSINHRILYSAGNHGRCFVVISWRVSQFSTCCLSVLTGVLRFWLFAAVEIYNSCCSSIYIVRVFSECTRFCALGVAFRLVVCEVSCTLCT